MAYRRKNDTRDTLEAVIWILLAIPFGIIAILKWIFSLLSNTSKTSNVSAVNLTKIDSMDGWQFEYYVADLLRKHGYSKVYVTSGSGDFGVDITATKDNRKWAFQCKNYSSKLGVSPIQEVYSGATKYKADIAVVITNSYFTDHARELAKSLGVLLWDRAKLIQLMQSCNNTNEKDNSFKESANQFNAESKKKDEKWEQKELAHQLVCLLDKVVKAKQQKNHDTYEKENEKIKIGEDIMATTLGAGKYVFGIDIPEGKYNLKAISGTGTLQIEKLIDGSWEEEWISFGIESQCARTYYGLSLPKNKYFEVTGNVVFEITKSKMIEIE